jgi:chromosome segregation ATPase
MDINLNINFKFENSLMDVTTMGDIKTLVTTLLQKGTEFMASAQEKLTDLEGLVGGLRTSITGISGDLQQYADQRSADAAEIESLKQAVLAAQSTAGELSPELAERFDALKSSLESASQQAKEIDDRLPEIPANPTGGGDPATGGTDPVTE